jgi:hypothetical protein
VKKILWCGGSHLVDAMGLIREEFSFTENTFYGTAGPANLAWSKEGGRYQVKGTVVGGNAHQPSVHHDLQAFDFVIFVGQLVMPQMYFYGRTPLSTSILEAMLPVETFLEKLPGGGFNEPLTLFPRLAPGRCVLACDPLPTGLPYVEHVPLKAKRVFLEHVSKFCHFHGLRCIFQPDVTVAETLSTAPWFRKQEDDRMHMNADFWRQYLLKIRDELELRPD